MSKILKIKIDDVVDFPVRSSIISIGHRDGTLYAWAIVDGDESLTARRNFLVIGTGREFNRRGWDYLGTVQTNGTWHIFTHWENEDHA